MSAASGYNYKILAVLWSCSINSTSQKKVSNNVRPSPPIFSKEFTHSQNSKSDHLIHMYIYKQIINSTGLRTSQKERGLIKTLIDLKKGRRYDMY